MYRSTCTQTKDPETCHRENQRLLNRLAGPFLPENLINPRSTDPEECHRQNMEMLGISRLNPTYLLDRIYSFFKKR